MIYILAFGISPNTLEVANRHLSELKMCMHKLMKLENTIFKFCISKKLLK